MRAMQQQVQKLKVKSAFLLQNLLVGHPEHKGRQLEQRAWGGPGGWVVGKGVHRGGVRTVPLTPESLPSGTLCSMGMVQQLVALVRTEHSPFHEHVLGALCRCAGAPREQVLGRVPPPPGMAPLDSGLLFPGTQESGASPWGVLALGEPQGNVQQPQEGERLSFTPPPHTVQVN